MKPTYNAIGDPFVMAGKRIVEESKTPKVDHDCAFKPYGHEKRKVPKKAAAPWMTEANSPPDPKRFRDEEGGFVVIQPAQMLTSPGKKGKFGGNPKNPQ